MLGLEQRRELVGELLEFVGKFDLAAQLREERGPGIRDAERLLVGKLRGAARDRGDGERAVGVACRKLHVRMIGAEGNDEVVADPAPRDFDPLLLQRLDGRLGLRFVPHHFRDLCADLLLLQGRDELLRIHGDALKVVFVRDLEFPDLHAGRELLAELREDHGHAAINVHLRTHGLRGDEHRRDVALQERGDQLGRGVAENFFRVRRLAAAHRGHEDLLHLDALDFADELDPRHELFPEARGIRDHELIAEDCLEDVPALHPHRRIPLPEHVLDFRIVLQPRHV